MATGRNKLATNGPLLAATMARTGPWARQERSVPASGTAGRRGELRWKQNYGIRYEDVCRFPAALVTVRRRRQISGFSCRLGLQDTARLNRRVNMISKVRYGSSVKRHDLIPTYLRRCAAAPGTARGEEGGGRGRGRGRGIAMVREPGDVGLRRRYVGFSSVRGGCRGATREWRGGSVRCG